MYIIVIRSVKMKRKKRRGHEWSFLSGKDNGGDCRDDRPEAKSLDHLLRSRLRGGGRVALAILVLGTLSSGAVRESAIDEEDLLAVFGTNGDDALV